MSAHTYPRTVMLADAGRAGAGLALNALPLGLLDMPRWQEAVLAPVALVFVLYTLSALRRALSPIDVSDEAICVRGPWPRRLSWVEVERLRLAYYSTRRDGGDGWMQLTLAGARTRVVVDSRIGGFDALVRRAADAARMRAVRLDPTTVVNLRGLGIVPAQTVHRRERLR